MRRSPAPLAPRVRVAGLLALARRAPGPLALLMLALAGVVISTYLTSVHYAGVPLVCTTTGAINCAAVTSSAYSVVPGTALPITLPGLFWFVVSGALASLALVQVVRGQAPLGWLPWAQVVWAGLGLIVVLYLVYVEIVLLRQICEWCTVVHLLALASFLVAVQRVQFR